MNSSAPIWVLDRPAVPVSGPGSEPRMMAVGCVVRLVASLGGRDRPDIGRLRPTERHTRCYRYDMLAVM